MIVESSCYQTSPLSQLTTLFFDGIDKEILPPIRLTIHYYKGWNWITKYSSAIPAKCYIELSDVGSIIGVLHQNEVGWVIPLSTPVFFSWGEGPTCSINHIILFENGRCGYFTKPVEDITAKNTTGTPIQIWTLANSPQWSFTTTDDC